MLSCMTELSVDVLKITKHPNEAAIKVRWRIKGIPLVRKLAPFIGRRVKVDADGFRYTTTFVAALYFILVRFRLSADEQFPNCLWTVFNSVTGVIIEQMTTIIPLLSFHSAKEFCTANVFIDVCFLQHLYPATVL